MRSTAGDTLFGIPRGARNIVLALSPREKIVGNRDGSPRLGGLCLGKLKAVDLEKLVAGMQIVSNLVRSGLSSHESRPLSTIYLLSQDEPVFIRRSISGFLVMAARMQK
uniref:Uncharacterized protein n=1 Tax=Coccidioides posadasii RMSCC 3488 TaxID=454284 RepID=A0A0J6IEE5_COCPO|nr:hypothetical protein CPAG_06419 [Coccidioides posadasii RMSCC 3488]